MNFGYDSRPMATGDIKWRFGINGYGSPKKPKLRVMPVIQSLSATPANRDVRVHDFIACDLGSWITWLDV